MEFEFTERLANFFIRVIDIRFEDIEQDSAEFDKERDKFIRNSTDDNHTKFHSHVDFDDNFGMKIYFQFKENENFDDDDEDIPYYDYSDINILFKIYYKQIPFFEYSANCGEGWRPQIIDAVQKYISCKCLQALTKKDGWCVNCYPYVIKQDDICPVCLENEGVWIQYSKCGHKVHYYCHKNLLRQPGPTKCPMCRVEVGVDCPCPMFKKI